MSENLSKEINKQYLEFYNQAQGIFGNRIYIDYLRRFAFGTDASCYRYVPKIVIKAFSEDEIIKILHLSDKFNLAVTFRGYGSSLSGQALSDSILVITTLNWRNILANKDSIRLSCGVIGSDANMALKDFNKKIGPDPATLAMASIGGIISNNSSGMCCGVKQNSYQTIKSIRVILQCGTILDTGDRASVESFLNIHKNLVKSILELRDEILSDEPLLNLIKRKYKIKNTTGYSINSLVDFSDIVDILNHIFVGSEGTLGFISSVELFSVDDYKFKACGLLFYNDILDAAKAVKILSQNDEIISSAEIMDYWSLKSVQNINGIPDIIKEIKEGNTCILIQTESNVKSIVEQNLAQIKDSLKDTNMAFEPLYSQDEAVFNQWWNIRKGILPISSSLREDGSSVITEDICFEIDNLGAGIQFIQDLFKKYQFKGIIFGHALSGNIHFIITPNLDDSKQRENFENLVFDMAEGVSNMGGSIKAEHGTGRMVAPFVEMEWGKKAYSINRKIKNIFDPKNLLNPDVIITNDPLIHTKNIKEMAKIDDFINKCMECGFCEKACPSNHLTLSPRQRIAVVREMQRLKNLNTKDSNQLFNEMQEEYQYLGDETCAVCSMCSTLCPLEIDTAKIALNLRLKQAKGKHLAKHILNHMGFYVKSASFGLKIANMFSVKFLNKQSSAIRKISSYFPYIPLNLPQGNSFHKHHNTESNMDSQHSVIYFTTCMNRAFAPSKNIAKNADKRPLDMVVTSLCEKANINIIYPPNIEGLCCGKAFVNYDDLQKENISKLTQILLSTSQNGKIPIILDHSACSMHLIKALKDSPLLIYDLPMYIYDVLMPRLNIVPKDENIAVYAMCALKKSNKDYYIESIAKCCTNGKIIKNNSLFCCGFAGNKGFFTPQLNKNALQSLDTFYDDKDVKRGFGSSITCEIGLNDYSPLIWQHIAYLVDEVAVEK
ncbi:lactate dehydrogenase [Helicobacter sp. 16-1353]|uniref:FAD-binding and (Fe-S)-binding domain-containing protein n=1 Tax=Helicobacter sp. 16-1353 TaxID=2004996 RepID=UPI000DCED5AF|nr:FAD-binding and (Fe-S)-binding domain-containing protein [Helicobacter sp. 16-1353]RAX54633.1 lactate dehydrogenase [Helicobacter sp. 16-1353]